ncbi:PP2C family protein-serine/threonine phosphatase [Streptomyces sp. NBC_00572]|uniref:PP2C family protein-serine/threonine phosphatase n=1 Tax=Streptomyces sp. NBC_00572 TaxID=2903664 RepID=UPI00224FFCB0|nr:PP2C family protein-serine/threonine phosphatase [Streptomyces sp. NBC_00572]MCX4985614.1 serine/threonine-protein phosphatase [Streptomyces sp. NBC_00572]
MAERDAEREEALLTRVRAMEQAIGEIGTTLDETTTCRELATFAARHLRSSATIDLRTEPGAPARRAARADPASVPGERAAGIPVTPIALGAPGPSGPIPGGSAPTPGDPAAGVTHQLVLPLSVHDEEPLGTVTLTRVGGAPFSGGDADLLRHAARLAARHLGHARRLAATEDTALHLQRALVAEPGRPHPNLEIAGGYLPAGPRALVGGDWFETVRLHFGRSLLVVGDVMGHGLDAAVDMNAYRTALREVAATDLPPHRVLRHLDSVVAEDDARRPATVLLVRVDPARGTATFAGAGHLPPVVFAADGSAELVDLLVGPPLGTGVGGYEPPTRPLRPGDTLLLFTDGLVERRGEDIDVSLARLAALRLPPDSGPDQVVDEVLRRLGAHGAEDDVAVLAARIRVRPPQ